MQTANFQNLIQLITGRPFIIETSDLDLRFETEYFIYRVLPVTKRKIYFKWKSPKSEDKFLRSFITAFTTKYREPNPASYNYEYGGKYYTWDEKTDEQKEFCYYHHASHMFGKAALMQQVEANFSNEGIASGLIKYGFYETLYGVGIFCFWMTPGVKAAILTMKNHLSNLAVPFSNEFSEAGWVFRFKIGLTKESHLNIINQLG
jgi:hypothetical protein